VQLFHFSEDPGIALFAPRPVAVPSPRPPGQEWLNGPLVWAIDEWHQPLYLFPRECPRVLLWPTAATTSADRAVWLGSSGARMIAHAEREWLERIRNGRVYRYELPPGAFEPLDDAGMHVSRDGVEPLQVELLDDLPAALATADVELRVLDSLAPLRAAFSTTLHASGIRLRNSATWAEGAGP
jgi:hypothetical protein